MIGEANIRMSEAVKPVPNVTPQMAPFFAGARQGQLLVQKCNECGILRFPAQATCTNCLSAAAGWIVASGRGEILSFNVMHQVYHPGFAAEVPYAVVMIKLEEGPKVVSNLVGVKPDEIRCGLPVEVVFERVNDQITLPKFRLRAAA
jgi:uncharacterized OB-fold protein